ncbi:serine hydrolase domain-containing protein [Nocardia sp. CA-119907]|uniref:serine hydrolase domain-containing protein n=1 Tax=Nocardia sp. CA-119907 TaxID=3239973 RepID=UPI003D97D9F7
MGRNKVGLRGRLCILATISIVAAAVTAGCGGQSSSSAVSSDLSARIDRLVQAHQDAGLFPEVVVAVNDPEHGSYVHAYGTADVATHRAASVNDHFRIGSTTKSFNATAVLQLVDQGKLSLDDVIDKYVPGIPNGSTIRIRDLLGMRGGLYDYVGYPEWAAQGYLKQPPAVNDGDLLQAIRANPGNKDVPPNTQTDYSDANYFLLGLVMEKITGKPGRDVFNDLIAQVGLHDTTYPADASMPSPESRGYVYDSKKLADYTSRSTLQYPYSSAIISTVPDLAKWMSQLGSGALLKPETFQAQTQYTTMVDGVSKYGFGVRSLGKWIGHGGLMIGYTTAMGYLPEKHATIVVAANLTKVYDPFVAQWMPMDAGLIWNDLVEELYPGTGPLKSFPSNVPDPALPTAADLNSQLQQALDPNIPAAQKTLRTTTDAQDPDAIDQLARGSAELGMHINIEKVNQLRHGAIMATGTATNNEHTGPIEIPLEAKDGQWRLTGSWAKCITIRGEGPFSPKCL